MCCSPLWLPIVSRTQEQPGIGLVSSTTALSTKNWPSLAETRYSLDVQHHMTSRVHLGVCVKTAYISWCSCCVRTSSSRNLVGGRS